jgi:hypothetical protein
MARRAATLHRPALADILAKGVRHEASGCLLWPGVMQLKSQGNSWSVLRLVWTLVHGDIATVERIYRSCESPSCIEPTHLRRTRRTTRSVDEPNSVVKWDDVEGAQMRLRMRKAWAWIHISSPELISVALDDDGVVLLAVVLDHDLRRRNRSSKDKEARCRVIPRENATHDELVALLLERFTVAIERVGLQGVVSVRRRTELEHARVAHIYEQQEVSTTVMHPVDDQQDKEPDAPAVPKFSLADLKISWG